MFRWNVIGHDKIKDYFEALLKREALSHFYMFTGPERVGKYTLARELARRVLCWRQGGENCLCPSCRLFRKGNHPDFLAIKPGQETISIEDLRKIKKQIRLKPYLGRYKIVLIDDFYRATPEAQNSFLKILEEPPSHSLFITVTHTMENIVKTIPSRAQLIRFYPVEKSLLLKSFQQRQAFSAKPAISGLFLGKPGIARDYYSDPQGFEKRIKGYLLDFFGVLSQPVYKRFKLSSDLSKRNNLREEISFWQIFLMEFIFIKLALKNRETSLFSISGCEYIDPSRIEWKKLLKLNELLLRLKKDFAGSGGNLRLSMDLLSVEI